MSASSSESRIKTTLFIISDTHGDQMPEHYLRAQSVDVAIHCGDLTHESKLEEFRTTLDMMERVDAPLKIMIAGNHDFTLDDSAFVKKVAEIRPPVEPALVEREYGRVGQARELLERARSKEIHYLNEGNHKFNLANGAVLRVFASPFTPSVNDWGFQYHPDDQKEWLIDEATDVVVTHGPPKGIFDMSNSKRLGCPYLFEAIARVRPRLHCFGHVHSGWGAKLVTWNQLEEDAAVSYFTAIDQEKSPLLASLQKLRSGRLDSEQDAQGKDEALSVVHAQDHARLIGSPEHDVQTLFVNAATQSSTDRPWHQPWVVELEIPRRRQSGHSGYELT